MVDGSGNGYDGWWDDRLDKPNVYQWDNPPKSPKPSQGNFIKITDKGVLIKLGDFKFILTN